MRERDCIIDDPELFAEFVSDAHGLLPLLAAKSGAPPAELAIRLHGLRGTAGFYGLCELCEAIAALETRLASDAGAHRPTAAGQAARRVAMRIAGLSEMPPTPDQPAGCDDPLRLGAMVPGLRHQLDHLNRELGRESRLAVRGAKVRIGRAAFGPIRTALVQLLRNAADHGIEPADARIALGKPPIGTIRLAARRTGRGLRITISDDGRGLGPALRSELPAAGVSTARDSPVSGLGLGLQVVRDAMTRLGGSLETRSVPGRGFRITLVVTDPCRGTAGDPVG